MATQPFNDHLDESERLSATALELLRDRYDRDNIALILVGMPGIEKWFSRYAQLYSRSASPTNTVRSPSPGFSCRGRRDGVLIRERVL